MLSLFLYQQITNQLPRKEVIRLIEIGVFNNSQWETPTFKIPA